MEERDWPIMYRDSRRIVESITKNTIVNCWHMNEGESLAMWKLYVPNNQGIVIHTTIDRLIRSFCAYDGENPQQVGVWLPTLFVKIGFVKYIDFDQYDGVGDDIYLLKRRNFKHEEELRAIVEDKSFMGDPHPDNPRFRGSGDFVPCDIATLIKEIYMPPGAPSWIRATVISLVRKYGHDFPVNTSVLDRDPRH